MKAFNCRVKEWEYVESAQLTDEEIAELQEQAERDAVNPVYNALAELVGMYVEIA